MSEIKSDKKGFLLYLIIYLCRGNFISRFFDNREFKSCKISKEKPITLSCFLKKI